MNILMKGHVLWSCENEIAESGLKEEISALFSFVKPLHHHEGEIFLTDASLIINGDVDLNIPLGNLSQLYLGFDDTYRSTYVKNVGLFWQPLRVNYTNNGITDIIYLVIDHTIIGTANDKLWFDALKQILSE